MLDVVDKNGHLERLRRDNVSVANTPGNYEAPDMEIANPMDKSRVFGVRAWRVITVTARKEGTALKDPSHQV
jgi:hypothetical protein